jgi:hypothetical protein
MEFNNKNPLAAPKFLQKYSIFLGFYIFLSRSVGLKDFSNLIFLFRAGKTKIILPKFWWKNFGGKRYQR